MSVCCRSVSVSLPKEVCSIVVRTAAHYESPTRSRWLREQILEALEVLYYRVLLAADSDKIEQIIFTECDFQGGNEMLSISLSPLLLGIIDTLAEQWGRSRQHVLSALIQCRICALSGYAWLQVVYNSNTGDVLQ